MTGRVRGRKKQAGGEDPFSPVPREITRSLVGTRRRPEQHGTRGRASPPSQARGARGRTGATPSPCRSCSRPRARSSRRRSDTSLRSDAQSSGEAVHPVSWRRCPGSSVIHRTPGYITSITPVKSDQGSSCPAGGVFQPQESPGTGGQRHQRPLGGTPPRSDYQEGLWVMTAPFRRSRSQPPRPPAILESLRATSPSHPQGSAVRKSYP